MRRKYLKIGFQRLHALRELGFVGQKGSLGCVNPPFRGFHHAF
jgi:hypothetical protein